MTMRYGVVQLRPHGMFSNVNQVIDALYLAERGGYKVLVRWGRDSCYFDPVRRSEDVWGYYFEPVSQADQCGSVQDCVLLENTAFRKDNVITPRVLESNALRPPEDRFLVRGIIERHIRLKPHVARAVEEFKSKHFKNLRGPLVGLHVRGPGKQDGGTEYYKPRLELQGGVPFAAYRERLDGFLARHPESTIFLASDSQMVVDAFTGWYGDRVTTYPSIRDQFGEMHARNRRGLFSRRPKFSPYQLGEDVVVEAYLLSSTDHLIHGISNVSAFVACNNPEIPCEDIFSSFRGLSVRVHDSHSEARAVERASLFAVIEQEEGLWQSFASEHLGQDAELLSISTYSCRRRAFRVGEHFVKVRNKGPETTVWKQTLRGEFETLQRLKGVPGVCRGLRHYEDPCWEALWCGYVRGTTLQHLCNKQDGGIPAGLVWRVFITVLRCNLRGVAHRDLRLDNVLVSESGQITVVDYDQAVRLPATRALTTDMLGLFGGGDPPWFTFAAVLSQGRVVGRIVRTAARLVKRARRAVLMARRAGAAVKRLALRRPTLPVDRPDPIRFADPVHADDLPGESIVLLQQAWDMARASPANAPGDDIAYYSLEVGDLRFEGERPWQLRWHHISRRVDFRGKRFLELGCNMGLLSVFARRRGAVECHAVDRDETILASGRLVARAFGVDVRYSQVDFDSAEDWEAMLSGYDLVAGLSVAHWLKDEERFLSFLGRHKEALFEGHDGMAEEIRCLESVGFRSIEVIGISERGREIYHLAT